MTDAFARLLMGVLDLFGSRAVMGGLTIPVVDCLPPVDSSIPQLDESKAYEEMVETLTTKNLEMGERCGELEATIADLESSVEMSEELETQQAEDIRELQVY